MTHINDINNLPVIDNDGVYINWVIDRNPDYNLINNINTINNVNDYYVNLDYELHALMNEYDNIIHPDDAIAIDIDNTAHPDDFIPFEPQNEPSNHIVIEVQNFHISEEDCNCCVCMNMKENDQICQLNCLHKFCVECTLTHFRRNGQQTFCPLCRTPVTNISVQTEAVRETFI